jgi:hypothetical protein
MPGIDSSPRVKKVVLNVRQQRADRRRQRVGTRPQGRIQLVDGPIA